MHGTRALTGGHRLRNYCSALQVKYRIVFDYLTQCALAPLLDMAGKLYALRSSPTVFVLPNEFENPWHEDGNCCGIPNKITAGYNILC